MKFLLDTHALIWWDANSALLSPVAKAAIMDPTSDVIFSVASMWELVIKHQAGKLSLTRAIADIATDQATNGLRLLPIQIEHVLAIGKLPGIHSDPFDRALIAQAQVEGAAIISKDVEIRKYSVAVLW